MKAEDEVEMRCCQASAALQGSSFRSRRLPSVPSVTLQELENELISLHIPKLFHQKSYITISPDLLEVEH